MAPEVCFNSRFEVEHVVPSSQAGPGDAQNLALSCRSCNVFKSNQMEGLDPSTGEAVRLFHPRQDRWQEHFAVDAQSRITGKTPTGRVTVIALHLNSEEQITARRRWVTLGLFPQVEKG
jgi:5-methylcytosine-specific restriction endonuclease McrA